MVILLIHNFYRQFGGEDAGVRQERDLLAAAGHRIVEYTRKSSEIALNGLPSRISLGSQTLWSKRTFRELRALLAEEEPDVAYVHNTLPLISPSAYYACAEAGVPIVQTLHNYRLACPAGTFFRRGQVCEECAQHSLLRSIRHGCYQDSRSATTTVALMVASQRALGTWKEKVGCYIVRTEFARQKFIDAGLPKDRIVVKPCFVHPDPDYRTELGDTALFVGRLSPEKGLRTLLAAWQSLDGRFPLKIAGEGPLRPELEAEIRRRGIKGVEMLGRLSGSEVFAEMKRSRFVIFPSEWYEGLPLTIVEAFACGVPVIASRLGSMIELVSPGLGLHFTPGDAEDLAAKVEWAWTHPREMQEMGRNARTEYEAKYTAERNYAILEGINRRVTQTNGRNQTRK